MDYIITKKELQLLAQGFSKPKLHLDSREKCLQIVLHLRSKVLKGS